MDTRDYLSPDEAEQLRQDLEETRKALHRANGDRHGLLIQLEAAEKTIERVRAHVLNSPRITGATASGILAILDGKESSNG